MELFEYIKSQLPNPNPAIMYNLGASDELVAYIKETPWNTNLNMLNSIGSDGGGGDTGEVWLVGDNPDEGMFLLSNVDATDHMTELFNNADSYDVFLNGEKLYSLQGTEQVKGWADNEDVMQATKMIRMESFGGTTVAGAQYRDASTAPNSVEVSVKAK